MNDIPEGQKTSRARRGLVTFAVIGFALIGAAAALYVITRPSIKPGEAAGPPAAGGLANLSAASAGHPMPATAFIDADDHTLTLADLTKGKAAGRVLVVNLWATWCGPCVKEMPSLARLQTTYAGRVVVAPISVDDAADRDKARAFMAQQAPLPFYQDEKAALAFALTPVAEGFPTTIIYDAKGHERARLSGDADWTSPQAHAVIDAALGGG